MTPLRFAAACVLLGLVGLAEHSLSAQTEGVVLRWDPSCADLDEELVAHLVRVELTATELPLDADVTVDLRCTAGAVTLVASASSGLAFWTDDLAGLEVGRERLLAIAVVEAVSDALVRPHAPPAEGDDPFASFPEPSDEGELVEAAEDPQERPAEATELPEWPTEAVDAPGLVGVASEPPPASGGIRAPTTPAPSSSCSPTGPPASPWVHRTSAVARRR